MGGDRTPQPRSWEARPEKHMTFIKLNGAGKRALAEIRAGEIELGVGCAAVAAREQTLVGFNSRRFAVFYPQFLLQLH